MVPATVKLYSKFRAESGATLRMIQRGTIALLRIQVQEQAETFQVQS